jgi:hypothetical protein
MTLKLHLLSLGLAATFTGCASFPQLEEAAPFDASQAEFINFLSADALQNTPEEIDETQITNIAGQLETLRQRSDQLRTKDLAAN